MERTIVGIDVGTTKVCTLVGEVDAEGALRIVGVGVVPSRGMRKGVVVNVQEASAAIAESVAAAERVSGYRIERAFVGISGAHIASLNSRGVVAVGRGERIISYEDIDRALEAAGAIAIPHNRRVVHVIPRGYTVDGQNGVRNPVGMHGFRLELEAHIVTAAATALYNLARCVEEVGVAVDEIVLAPLASGQAVLTETEREMGVALADIGGGTTDIAIFIDGTIWHTVVVPVGGYHLTNDLAIGLRLPFETAEAIKLRYGHARPQDVPAEEVFTVQSFGDEPRQQVFRREMVSILEARVEEIFSLIGQEIRRSGYEGLLPAGLVVCGGTAQLPGLRQMGQEVLGMPVRVGRPRDLRGLVDTLVHPAYATGVGLLQWGVEGALHPRYPLHPSNGSSPLLKWLGGWLRNFLPG